MKISTKGRYGLSFMLDILTNYHGEPICIKEIACRQGVSDKYLEQIAGTLLRSGLVGSVRGAGGGYFPRRKPEDYTAGEILRIMEGDLAPVPCVETGNNSCQKQGSCVSVILWEKIRDAVNEVVNNVTLADMCRWQTECR